MKVFIAGSTGVLGRRLITQFRARGHDVIGLARNARGEQTIRSLGGEPQRAEIFDGEALARAAEASEVVIHAATAIPTKAKTSPGDWATNDRIRREGTRALAECAAKIGARLYLQQSIVWVARPPDQSDFDEDSPTQYHPIFQSALDGEQIAREAGERAGFRVAVLRCGAFYSADSAHTRLLGERLANRRMPIMGKGDAVWALLHADDAASAFLVAAEGAKSGLWHVVDDQPIAVAEYLLEFARLLGAPRPLRLPVWLARLVAGKAAVDYMTVSTRTSNARFRRDTGWVPRFPTFREGSAQVVSEWRKERFPWSQ